MITNNKRQKRFTRQLPTIPLWIPILYSSASNIGPSSVAVGFPVSGMEINIVDEIWPELIQRTIAPPKTITETVDRLVTVLDDEHKVAIAAMHEEDLVNLHFSLGSAIRNAFGFWDPGSPLLTSCNAMSPDDVSDQVIFELWKRLKQKSVPRGFNNTFSH